MNKLFVLLCLLCILGTPLAGPSQVEFVATLKSVETLEETTFLSMELTPEISLGVVVSEATEIKDENELAASANSLQVGQTLKIQGVFGEAGLVATLIIVTDDNHAFELRGEIREVGPGRQIRIYDFLIQIPESTHIHDQFGEALEFEALQVEQYVKVSGVVEEGRFLAREVKVRVPDDGFARVRFSGLLGEFVDDRSFIVEVEGDVSVLVYLTEETEVLGKLVPGASLHVVGVIGDDLSVKAIKVEVLGVFELIPPRLEMSAGGEKMVQVVLRQVLDEDLELRLHSTDPEVAMAASESVVVEEGKLVGKFVVVAKREGAAAIVAAAPGAGEEAVKVLVEDPEPELRIQWRPEKVETDQGGEFEVRLLLNHPAEEDIRVHLKLVEPDISTSGDSPLVRFPLEVRIPSGQEGVSVPMQAGFRSGRALIRAQTAGGAHSDLLVEVGGSDPLLRIGWRPEAVEVGFLQEFGVVLHLNQPAPVDLRARISLSGDSQLVDGMPGAVEFEEGQEKVEIRLKSGNRAGRLRFLATLPEDLGGATAEIVVEVVGRTLRVEFVPGEVGVPPGEEFRVRVVLSHPAPEAFRARLKVVDGVPDVVERIPEGVEFAKGVQEAHLGFVSTQTSGRLFLQICLPEELGGGEDGLVIEVDSPPQAELRVEFVPGEVELPFNEDIRVGIVLNHPAPREFRARIKVIDGNPEILRELPESVVFEEGSREASLGLISREKTGRVFLQVCLPEDLGGDEDGLVVEVFGGPKPEWHIAWGRDGVEVDPEGLFELGILLDPAAPADFFARLKVVEGSADLLVEIPEGVGFEEGTEQRGLVLRAGPESGRLVLRICLPEDLEGGCDDIVVEIG